MSDQMGGMVCEVCGAPADRVARDLREVMPTHDASGNFWVCFEAASEARYGCSEHPPRASQRLPMQPEVARAWAAIKDAAMGASDG